jgi:hypothetical protein
MHGILDEFNCLGCAVFDKWFVFSPFGELVNCHENVLETTLSSLKRSYLVQPLARERPSRWDADKIMCQDVSLSCKHLVDFTLSDEFFYVF